MDDNSHTARFLVSLFLNSKYSLDYKLTMSHRSLLRYLADLMDHQFSISGIRKTSLHINQMAIYAGCRSREVKYCLAYMKKKRIINKEGGKGKKPIMWIGWLLTTYQQRHAKLSTRRAQSTSKKGTICPYLTISSNSKDNNKETFNKSENQKPKNAVVQTPEEAKVAIRQLAKKLG